ISPLWTHGQDGDILFESLDTDLPSNSVRTIARDSWGYVWFGTSGGLVRYDGMNSHVYEKGTPHTTGLSHNGINAILEDRSNRFWIGTSVGLNLYVRELDKFVNPSVRHKDMLGNAYIKELIADKEGRLWIGTFGSGLMMYDHQA